MLAANTCTPLYAFRERSEGSAALSCKVQACHDVLLGSKQNPVIAAIISSGCFLAKESCCGRFTEEKRVLCSNKLLFGAERNPQMLLARD